MHLLQPLAHHAERLAEPRLERALQPLVHGDAHLFQTGRVVLQERAQPLFDRLAKRVHPPFARFGERAKVRRERVAEPGDGAAHLFAQRAPLAGRLRPPQRHLVAQRPLDLGVARFDRDQPGLDLRQIHARRPHDEYDEENQRREEKHDGKDEQRVRHRPGIVAHPDGGVKGRIEVAFSPCRHALSRFDSWHPQCSRC